MKLTGFAYLWDLLRFQRPSHHSDLKDAFSGDAEKRSELAVEIRDACVNVRFYSSFIYSSMMPQAYLQCVLGWVFLR